eukprot:m.225334 g.225334  ORF g.225334 m.225334 type:complete len:290 (+) comp11251_c0_seq1:95-964(+)
MMPCVSTVCSTLFLEDPVPIALFVIYSVVPAVIGLVLACLRHQVSPQGACTWMGRAVLSDFRDDEGQLRSLFRFIKARHPSTQITTALTPLFRKKSRDGNGVWVSALLYRINALLLIEMGAAMSLAILLKAASVNMDDSVDCEGGVAVQAKNGCDLHYNSFSVLVAFILAVVMQPVAMLGDAYVDLAMCWRLADQSSDATVSRGSFWSRLGVHIAFAALTVASMSAAIGWRAVVGHWDGTEMMFYGFLVGMSRVFQMFGVEIVFTLARYVIFYRYASASESVAIDLRVY